MNREEKEGPFPELSQRRSSRGQTESRTELDSREGRGGGDRNRKRGEMR